MPVWIESFRQRGLKDLRGETTVLTKTKSQKARARATKRVQLTRAPRLKGSGMYDFTDIKEALKPVVRQALMSGGAVLGGMVHPTGNVFGAELGGRLSKIIGSGDYETSTSVNSLIRPPGGAASASFGSDPSLIRIRRREFLMDIRAPPVAGDFVNYPFSINAGLRETFPFLSQVAANFEEYCFDGLVFEFISSSSPYISGSAIGTVIAAMSYNAASPDFTNKYTMENSAFAVSTRIDKNLMYGVECAKGSNPQNCYYTRQGASGLPLPTTDLGKFQLALAPSTSIVANTVLGELWVTYDVVLKRPVLSPSRSGVYHLIRGSGVTNAAPLGASGSTLVQTNTGAVNMIITSTTTIAFSDAVAGDVFMLTWYVQGSANSPGVPTVASLTITGGNPTNALNQDTAAFLDPTYSATTQKVLTVTCFTATASSGVLTFPGTNTNFPTGTVYTEVFITLLGNSLSASSF
jgi:hypothetical protein